MALDPELAERVADLVTGRPGMSSRRMFGGLAWLVNGNMAVAIRGQGGLLVRVDPDRHEELLAEPGTDTMIMRGRELTGWMTVNAQACDSEAGLTAWVDRGLDYAGALPPK
ncbi:TfoX/Sxy family protein [Longispora sp. NPDC051575]|uniref:TfoX/Sxy family protein n=1 Tax=Longispora sp. NPDC051575 TaxID=3154943 RepID=UPI00342968FA